MTNGSYCREFDVAPYGSGRTKKRAAMPITGLGVLGQTRMGGMTLPGPQVVERYSSDPNVRVDQLQLQANDLRQMPSEKPQSPIAQPTGVIPPPPQPMFPPPMLQPMPAPNRTMPPTLSDPNGGSIDPVRIRGAEF